MTSVTELIDRYIAAWNETDEARRRDLLAQTWTDDAVYTDPLVHAETRAGIDSLIEGVQAQFPGFRFHLTGNVDAHNDRVRFRWELGPEGQDAPAAGTDFGVIVGGRLQSVTGFLDRVPSTVTS